MYLHFYNKPRYVLKRTIFCDRPQKELFFFFVQNHSSRSPMTRASGFPGVLSNGRSDAFSSALLIGQCDTKIMIAP